MSGSITTTFLINKKHNIPKAVQDKQYTAFKENELLLISHEELQSKGETSSLRILSNNLPNGK